MTLKGVVERKVTEIFARSGSDLTSRVSPFFAPDPILATAQQMASLATLPNLRDEGVKDVLLADPDFSSWFAPGHSQLPMIMSVYGGFRVDAGYLVSALLSAAITKQYYLSSETSEVKLVALTVDNLNQLREAIRGNKVGALTVYGLSGISVPEGSVLETPWGKILPAPKALPQHFGLGLGRPRATCLLVEEKQITLRFSLEDNPSGTFPQDEISPSKASELLPLACALASEDPRQPIVPLVAWSTSVVPLLSGFSYSIPPSIGQLRPVVDILSVGDGIRDWSTTLLTTDLKNIEIAIRRLISATTKRFDLTDTLVDAVMVWENLFGSDKEVSFRISASMAKFIENDPSRRNEKFRMMKKIYDFRSRIVHGSKYHEDELLEMTKEAIGFAIEALRKSIQLGNSWLNQTSVKRSDQILLR